MKTLLLFLAVSKLVSCGCPKGFELVRDGECRGLQSTATVRVDMSTKQAIARCQSIAGYPVIIHNAEHQAYWNAKVPHDSVDGIIILGIVCNTKKNKWEWSDGSKIDFKPPSGHYNNELDDPYCKEGYSWQLWRDEWTYEFSGDVDGLFYCTTQLQQEPRGAHGCDGFADDAIDGVCYQVNGNLKTRQDANTTCNKFGAQLASIHNDQENAVIRRLAAANGVFNGVFLGGEATPNGPFEWDDGTTMDYENYHKGYPDKNYGLCVAMDTSDANGQWISVDCAARLPFACIRAEQPVSAPVCTGEAHKEGAIITSPGFPFSANTPCDYQLTVPAGKKVQVEILDLEANTCCDSAKIYNGNTLRWTVSGNVHDQTYTGSSNTMRVSWQPKGGVNVKGLVFTYRAV